MKISKLDKMKQGWFIGDFEPNVMKTDQVEVAVKCYDAGTYEQKHYHKVASEITVIIEGEVLMNGIKYCSGDIILMEPGDATDFQALTQTKNVVVKLPGILEDKYIIEGSN